MNREHMDVIQLLKGKNRCIQNLLDLSFSFMDAQSSSDIPLESFSGALEGYQNQRSPLIKMIDIFDRKITEAAAALSPALKTPATAPRLIEEAQSEVDETERLLRLVLNQDERLMVLIEEKKAKILQEIHASRKSREIMGKFKSNWIAAGGEELDRQL